MARTGPGGLRLQEVAKAAGVSHPAILHHFGSREGLIRALNRRTIEALGEALRAQMEAPEPGNGNGVRASFAAYRGGFAQRIVWLLQSGALMSDQPVGPGLASEMAERLHAIRCAHAPPGREPDRADSEAVIHLIVVAALGDALIGAQMRRATDQAEETRRRSAFEDWLSALINTHLHAGAGRL